MLISSHNEIFKSFGLKVVCECRLIARAKLAGFELKSWSLKPKNQQYPTENRRKLLVWLRCVW